jgi:hypothetical protein
VRSIELGLSAYGWKCLSSGDSISSNELTSGLRPFGPGAPALSAVLVQSRPRHRVEPSAFALRVNHTSVGDSRGGRNIDDAHPILVPEQLALKQRLGDGCAFDCDRRPVTRGMSRQMARATSSLPVSLTPVIRTVESVGATRPTRQYTSRIAASRRSWCDRRRAPPAAGGSRLRATPRAYCAGERSPIVGVFRPTCRPIISGPGWRCVTTTLVRRCRRRDSEALAPVIKPQAE